MLRPRPVGHHARILGTERRLAPHPSTSWLRGSWPRPGDAAGTWDQRLPRRASRRPSTTFLDEQAERLAPARPRRGPAARRGAAVGRRAASGSARRSATGATAPSRPTPSDERRAAPRLRRARAAARQRAGPRRLHGRLRHPARPARDAPRLRGRAPRRRLARRPGAVRRRRRRSCSATCCCRWADELLRRCGLPLTGSAPRSTSSTCAAPR